MRISMDLALRNQLVKLALKEAGIVEESFSQSGEERSTFVFSGPESSAIISVDRDGYKVLGMKQEQRGVLYTSLSARATVNVVLETIGEERLPEVAELRPFIMLTNIANEHA